MQRMLYVRRTYLAYAQLARSAMVSVRDFIYKTEGIGTTFMIKEPHRSIKIIYSAKNKLHSWVYGLTVLIVIESLDQRILFVRTGCLQSSYSFGPL